MKIEVGDYVRTTKGYIFYIDRKERLDGLIFLDAQYGKIVKHSKNIIDLVEEGDYVNGECITDKWETRISSIKSNFSEEDIKTLVTKEQFSSIEYKVESEEK